MTWAAFDGRALLLLGLLAIWLWYAWVMHRHHRTQGCLRCAGPTTRPSGYHRICEHLERAEGCDLRYVTVCGQRTDQMVCRTHRATFADRLGCPATRIHERGGPTGSAR